MTVVLTRDSSSAVAPRHGRVAPGTDEPGTQSVELIDQLAHTIFAGCAGAPCGFGFVCDRCNQMVLMMLEHKLDLASARSKLPTSSRSQSRGQPIPTSEGWVDAIEAVSELPEPWLSVEHAAVYNALRSNVAKEREEKMRRTVQTMRHMLIESQQHEGAREVQLGKLTHEVALSHLTYAAMTDRLERCEAERDRLRQANAELFHQIVDVQRDLRLAHEATFAARTELSEKEADMLTLASVVDELVEVERKLNSENQRLWTNQRLMLTVRDEINRKIDGNLKENVDLKKRLMQLNAEAEDIVRLGEDRARKTATQVSVLQMRLNAANAMFRSVLTRQTGSGREQKLRTFDGNPSKGTRNDTSQAPGQVQTFKTLLEKRRERQQEAEARQARAR